MPRPRMLIAVLVVLWLVIVAMLLAVVSLPAHAEPTIVTPTVWTTVVADTFDPGSTLPSHWKSYNGHYGSGPHNCARPEQSTIGTDGSLHMKLKYVTDPSAKCGPGWYSGGLTLVGFSAISQRVTTRFRIVSYGGVVGHRIIPMRWPDVVNSTTVFGGEEDYCESEANAWCSTFLHWSAFSGRDAKKYFLDLSQWHTMTFERDGYHVTATIDGVVMWDFTGDEVSLPSTLKHVILQQECNKFACPTGTTGSEDIQIDSITVDNGV